MGQVEGLTALNCVAWAGDRALAKLLLDSQAEPHANGMGESPEEMARNSDQKHLLPLRLDRINMIDAMRYRDTHRLSIIIYSLGESNLGYCSE